MFFKIHDCEVLLTSVYEARYKLRSASNGRRKNFGQEKLIFLTTKKDPLRSKELRLVKKTVKINTDWLSNILVLEKEKTSRFFDINYATGATERIL